MGKNSILKIIVTIIVLFAVIDYAIAACPKTKMINQSNEPWTDRDYEERDKAAVRCKEKYPNSPCLKKFIKKAHLTYWVICGAG